MTWLMHLDGLNKFYQQDWFPFNYTTIVFARPFSHQITEERKKNKICLRDLNNLNIFKKVK